MRWTDEGIVLGSRRHGEGSVILELMTHEHGRHLGLVRGGAGARLRPVLQPANRLCVHWQARLEEHLGHYMVEALDMRAAAFLPIPHALFGITHVAALCRLLAEREPHPQVHAAVTNIIGVLPDAFSAAVAIVRFELQMLAELGFGLDLGRCAVSGATTDLIYVSPKSGRAVSRNEGEAWKHQLLRLPAFLAEAPSEPPASDDVASAFALTRYFLLRHVIEPRGLRLPDARASFIAAVTRNGVAAA